MQFTFVIAMIARARRCAGRSLGRRMAQGFILRTSAQMGNSLPSQRALALTF